MDSAEKRARDLEQLRARARTPEEFAALAEAVGDRQREPGWFVVLARQRDLPPQENILAFAKAIELDPFTARQRLIAPTARILRRFDQQPMAQEWADWLHTIGLRAFAISEETILLQEFVGTAAVYADQGVLVCDTLKGERQKTPLDKVCALVIGDVVEKRFTEQVQHGTLVEDLSFRRENIGHRTETVIDIHLRDTPISFRIAQDSFQWPLLFPGRTGASSLLIRELFTRLRQAAPQATAFEEFKRAEDVLGTSEQFLSASTFLAINWSRPSIGARVRVVREKTKLESNAETFDLYSTLARLEVLKA